LGLNSSHVSFIVGLPIQQLFDYDLVFKTGNNSYPKKSNIHPTLVELGNVKQLNGLKGKVLGGQTCGPCC
jgi:hypothetical protein